MASFTRKSVTEWDWLDGTHQRSVRYFPQTGRFIWSGYVMSSEGPVFEPGVAQNIDDFLERGAPFDALPSDLIAELREVVQAPAKKSGILARLLGR